MPDSNLPGIDVVPNWRAALEQAGLDLGDRRARNWLSETAGLARSYLFGLYRGSDADPDAEQPQRIIDAIAPFLAAAEKSGRLKEIE